VTTRLRGIELQAVIREAVRQAVRAVSETVGSGEVNTASNLGTGAEVFASKSGVNLRFRSLSAGPGMTVTENANDIEFEATAATTVAALTDVDLTGLASGDMLVWDGTDWIPVTLPVIPQDLDDLSDVDLTGASTGDVLTKDVGGDWVPQAPSAGVSLSYLGYNTIGGTAFVATASRQYNKKITVAADGILLNIAIYLRVTSQFWMSVQVGVQSDNAGVPDSILSSVSVGQINLGNNIDKWLTIPLNLEVAAGDYWLSFIANQVTTLYHDVGTDTYNDPGQANLKDGNLVAPTVTAHKYSMRAAFMAT
jgi:hypothetical protein